MIRKWLNNHLDHSETKNYINGIFFEFVKFFTPPPLDPLLETSPSAIPAYKA